MKIGLIVLGVLCIIAAIVMYIVGSDSSALSELKDFWYIPLPLGVIALIGGFRGNKK